MPETDLDVDSGWDAEPAPPPPPRAGATAHERYLEEGYTRSEYGAAFASQIDKLVPGASRGLSFYEKGGRVYPRGFVTSAAIAPLRAALPYLDFGEVRVTLAERPRRAPSPGDLPDDVKLADAVDLRESCPPVGDEGQTARTLAFAWTHALETCAKMQGKEFPRLSASFAMLQLQERRGDFKDFERAFLGGSGGTNEIGHVVFDEGSCRHELWPDDEAQPRASVDEMREDAKAHALVAELVDVALDDLEKALAAGAPVVVLLNTLDAFAAVGKDGNCPAPSDKTPLGAHAMICLGFRGDRFILRSAWGEGWGDGGYCYATRALLEAAEAELTAIVLPPRAGWIACPRCAVETPDAPFCTSCGLRLKKASFCSECGAPLEGTNVCSKCGTTTA